MNDFMINVFAIAGAFLATAGAAIQLGLDLGERQGYMRRAESLDKTGAEAAVARTFVMGYKHPEKLTWMPPETDDWLRLKTPSKLGWLSVGAGAYLMFCAAAFPFAGDEYSMRAVSVVIASLFALGVAVLMCNVITAGAARPGRERAETEWKAQNPNKLLPENSDSRFDRKLEEWHDRLFGRA